MMRARHFLVLPLLLSLSTGAHAEPKYILRIGTVAPDGTSWAREARALSRDVEIATKGEVRLKWYFGGIAGDDVEMLGRIERGQLDGAGSGGPLCMKASPSMAMMRVPGLFANRDEAAHVLSRLKPTFDEEFRAAGFVHLSSTALGQEMVLSRAPIRTLDELRKTRMWRWDLDWPAKLTDPELGLKTVSLPLTEGAAAYDDHRVDGFLVIPTAALAFQWYTRAHYLLKLRLALVWGCLVVANRAWDRLPVEHQQSVRSAAVKFALRMGEAGRQIDDALLGGLFEKQGLKTTPVSEALRAEFLSAARTVRDRLGERLIRADLLQRVLVILADYRAEHTQSSK